ncbi:MAG TPA: helix-turn-helix domain-containing protein [Streptomyces sp.]|nr:helix-turn-helix domain-containing protein [Streptomyces sp.]
MLHVRFDEGELTRLRVAERTDPLWETVLSLHLLQNRQAASAFDPWRREVRAALERHRLVPTVRELMRLCPPAPYFPDFLTPGRGEADMETALEQVLSTPRRRLAAELARVYACGPVPRSVRWVAEGGADALRWLGNALRRYHQVGVAPYAAVIRAQAAADRTRRGEAALAGGAEALLASYATQKGWEYGGRTLRAPYPVDRELRLNGRALTLLPGFFCVRTPLVPADESLPPVLVYPLSPAPGWLARLPRGGTTPPVGQLIGSTRSQVLDLLEEPVTTTGLAVRTGLAPSTVSHHVAVLREAGLVASRREGVRVLHRRTPLGTALLDGPVP